MEEKTALLAIACDMFEDDGLIRLGPDSVESCEAAIRLYKKAYEGLYLNKPIVLVTACASPDPKYKGAVMAHLMRGYCVRQGVKKEHVFVELATEFNTMGEMLACVRFLNAQSHITHVEICVKWWHALRCYILLQCCRKLFCNRFIWVGVETCKSATISPEVVKKEFWLAIPRNMIRIFLLLLKKKLGLRVL